ncbi:MAG: acyl-CoA thioesterase [Acidobacteria bacterium]|nr:acyl-CoA thioesterase [Acidobacteriota bacterium]
MRVRWIDTDAGGRVHYASVLRYFEIAEHELMRTLGFPYERLHRTLHAPRVQVWAEFKQPLFYDDEIAVHCWVEKVGRSSFSFKFQILKHNLLAVEGGVTAVVVDQQGKAVAHPEELRQALQKGLR